MIKFEKVSFNQFEKDMEGIPIDYTLGQLKDYYEAIKLPKRATKGSAGYDFYSPIGFILQSGKTIKFPTGIRCQMNLDIVLQIFIRSSIGFKYQTTLDNGTGIVDSDYYNSDNEGHMWIKITNHGNKDLVIKRGEAVCQGLFTKYYITDNDSTDGIRNGGFGSTNK